ncbi:DNA polymerase III subunit gamma/tau [Bacteroidota bacterium]
MENFIVSARKYRPDSFSTVVGQPSITLTLKSAIKSGHLAQAYLFCGPRGVGKTTCARIFAKTINCFNLTSDTEACNECESCESFNSGRSFNIHELDAASNNSVDDIRQLIEQVRIPPQVGKYSVYIIDEVHMLSQQAFNAFLKTLEEPPKHAVFILATTEKHKIIPTILSRCQIYDFNRISPADTTLHLEKIASIENVHYEKEALQIIALKADGALRDALSIFDQVVSFSGNNISYEKVIENLNVLDYEYYFQMVDYFLHGDINNTLLTFHEILEKGFDAQHFMNGLSEHLRNLLVSQEDSTIELLETSDSVKQKYIEQAGNITAEFILEALEITNKFDLSYKISNIKRLHIEIALLQLCNLSKKKDKYEQADTEKRFEENSDQYKSVKKENIPPVKKKANIPNISSFSIKNQLEEKSKKGINENSELKNHHKNRSNQFSEEELTDAWLEFAKSIQSKESRLYSILTSTRPVLHENFTVQFEVTNDLQQESFNHIKNELLTFLFDKLLNDEVKLDLIVKKEKPEQKKPYTNEDKFKYLSKKNTNLLLLKKRFNLDYE